MSKGSKSRVSDQEKYKTNFDKIFSKKKTKNQEKKDEDCQTDSNPSSKHTKRD